MLIQIADTHVFRPLDLAFVRLQLAGDGVHKGGFAFAVGADKADVLPFQQAEGYVFENGAIAKAVEEMFYG